MTGTAQPDSSPAAPPPVGASGTGGVALAGIVVAAAGVIVQLVSARTLTLEVNTQFLTFWSLLYLVIGITVGIQTETTRTVRAALHPATRPGQQSATAKGAPVVATGLTIGAGVGLLVLATSPLWGHRVLAEQSQLGVALVAFAATAFAGHAAVTGALAGAGSWSIYSRVTALESLVRIVLIAVVVLVAATLGGFMAASAVATAAWLIPLAVSRRARATLTARADRSLRQHVEGVWHAMLASTSTAIIVVGFPVLLSLTTSRAEYAGAAPLLLALSLTRAPLLLPLNVFQGVVITHLISHPEQRGAILTKIVAAVLGLGVVGGALAALVGPPILRLFTYEVGGGLLAALTAAGALLALLTLVGTAVLAAGAHRAYSAGWIAATVVSIAVLLLPWSIEARTIASLTIGPAVGIVIHALALLREGSPRRATSSPTPASQP